MMDHGLNGEGILIHPLRHCSNLVTGIAQHGPIWVFPDEVQMVDIVTRITKACQVFHVVVINLHSVSIVKSLMTRVFC